MCPGVPAPGAFTTNRVRPVSRRTRAISGDSSYTRGAFPKMARAPFPGDNSCRASPGAALRPLTGRRGGPGRQAEACTNCPLFPGKKVEPDLVARATGERTSVSRPFARASKGRTSVPRLFARASEGVTSAPRPFARASEGVTSVPRPFARASEGVTSVPRPFARASERVTSVPRPFARASEGRSIGGYPPPAPSMAGRKVGRSPATRCQGWGDLRGLRRRSSCLHYNLSEPRNPLAA